MEHGAGVRLAGRLALLLLLCGNAVQAADLPPAQKPLRWGADAEGGAPYVSMDQDHSGQYIGFEVDLNKEFEKELGRPIVFTQCEFKSLQPGLVRGDIDIAMNGMEATPDRNRDMRLSHPYYVYTLQLVVRANETRIASLDDCKAKKLRVATLTATAAARVLAQDGIEAKIYDDQTTPYKDLEQMQVDAVLLDLPIALQYTKRDPEFASKLKFAGKPIAPGFYVIGFRKEDEALAKKFDAAIEKFYRDGTLERIYRKWDLWNDDQAALATDKLAETVHATATYWTFAHYFPFLLQGAVLTVEITVLGFALAVIIGLPLATMRLYGPAPLRWAATLYVEFFRGIPVLLLLFFIYYSLPEISQSLKLNAFIVGVIGFGLNYAAYESEIYRAGIASIPIGQWEAGASLGMTAPQTFVRIILPQAIRVILPPTTNDLVALFKDTSVVSVIGVVELRKQYEIMANDHLQYLEIGFVTMLLYLMMSVPLAQLSRYLEKKWGNGR